MLHTCELHDVGIHGSGEADRCMLGSHWRAALVHMPRSVVEKTTHRDIPCFVAQVVLARAYDSV